MFIGGTGARLLSEIEGPHSFFVDTDPEEVSKVQTRSRTGDMAMRAGGESLGGGLFSSAYRETKLDAVADRI